jgi:hypothetical protein
MGMPPEFRALLERYNQLGRLLPPKDDIDAVLADPHGRAEAEVILREMASGREPFGKEAFAAHVARHEQRPC